MAEPIDAILAVHNAFRNDLEHIDADALDSARGREGLGAIIERFRFFNEVLVWHAQGEELAIFHVARECRSSGSRSLYERPPWFGFGI